MQIILIICEILLFLNSIWYITKSFIKNYEILVAVGVGGMLGSSIFFMKTILFYDSVPMVMEIFIIVITICNIILSFLINKQIKKEKI